MVTCYRVSNLSTFLRRDRRPTASVAFRQTETAYRTTAPSLGEARDLARLPRVPTDTNVVFLAEATALLRKAEPCSCHTPQARHRREVHVADWSACPPRRSGTRTGRLRTRVERRLTPKFVTGPSSALSKMESAGPGLLPHPKIRLLAVTGFRHPHGLATLSKRILPGRNRFGSPDSAADPSSVGVRW